MSFQLSHTLVFERFAPEVTPSELNPEEINFRVKLRGVFQVLIPGLLKLTPSATYLVRERTSSDGSDPIDGEVAQPGTTPLHGGFREVRKTIPLKLRIFTPDGKEFVASQVTVADLRRFQDLRGAPVGPWTYTLTGEKTHVFDELNESFMEESQGGLTIGVLETVPSLSAPLLVPGTPIGRTRQVFSFDLFRIGEFVAELRSTGLGRWAGSLRLIDPDGAVVAQTTMQKLRFEVTLMTLNKSRDSAGNARNWQLEVVPQRGIAGRLSVSATVVGRGKITIETLTKRVNALLGPRGEFIKLFGENKGGNMLARLKVTDVVSAETIDMHGLLDDRLESVGQDDGVRFNDFKAGVTYSLAKKSDAQYGLNIDVSDLKVGAIDFSIGSGVMLGASVPAIRLAIEVSGEARAKFEGAKLATATVRGGKLAFEAGIRLTPQGVPQIVSMVSNSPFDFDVDDVALLLALRSPAVTLGGITLVEYLEHEINESMMDGAKAILASPTLMPRILMTLFGAHLDYRTIRIEGGDILFDYLAPIEPESRHNPNYSGAIGREPMILSPSNQPSFFPLLSDTWKAENLVAKIDHVVVVMMENRSYDHVLGYRARPPFNDGADGLTNAMIGKINAAPNGPFSVRAMRQATFNSNDIGLKTRLPVGVGHEAHDVAEQLSYQTAGPDGYGTINSPKGFVRNFEPGLLQNPGDPPHGVVPDDVLGYYEPLDLPFYAYLADHYAYCDRYYCSHPGPTLPNRMYSLTGDLQRDRYGFPITDNNSKDNFLLSRTATIYDFLTRKGISWRVYESAPSVTMLRMFARYATNNTDIVPLGPMNDPFAQLRADVANNRLPAFTAIEPAMHHHPQNDDHPDADMYRGQLFLQGVYNTLRSNPDVWKRTLLIITYDEHGGLYDHVPPPLADFYSVSDLPTRAGGEGGPGRRLRDVVAPGEMPTTVSENPSAPPAPASATPGPLRVPYGVRVPTFVVSPWTKPGKGPSATLDHCSILKTVLARFMGAERPFLSDRVNASQTFNAFLSEPVARMDVPDPPELQANLGPDSRRVAPGASAIITPPLSRQAMRDGPVDYHALTGRLARMLGR